MLDVEIDDFGLVDAVSAHMLSVDRAIHDSMRTTRRRRSGRKHDRREKR
jgi:hypothetical protein